MINKIKSFFNKEESSNRTGGHDKRELQVAASALLIEAAMTDGSVDPDEMVRIADLIEAHFEISREEVSEILAEGEARAEAAVDIFSFLKVVIAHFDHEERIKLVEMLWEVAYADGELHDHEANLIRRVSSMLGLTDRESGTARKQVLARKEG